MATNVRRNTANSRTVLRNKPSNDEASHMKAKIKATTVSKMSPEAQRAMLLAQEDSKENCKSSLKSDNNNNTNDNYNNFSSDMKHIQHSVNGTGDIGKPIPKQALPRPKNTHTQVSLRTVRAVSTAGAKTTATARSRSTLSRTDKTYSTNDNNESYVDRRNKGRRNDHPPSNLDNSGSNANDEDSNGNGNFPRSLGGSESEEMIDRYDNNSRSRRNATDVVSKSFVLALDRALEENCISKLRGDITDTEGIAEPGKVRALDGGRLTNAQEVVVNVCHEDDRELVFHDDDDESLDNAKTISTIRVNIWMEYNEKFEPDNITDDLDIGTTNDDTDDSLDAATEKSKLKVPSKAGMPPKGRDNKASNKNNMSPGNGPNNKGQAKSIKKDGNSNRIGSARSKSGASGSYRDSSSTRWGSAVSNDGSRQSGNSSAKKRELFKHQS